jgi:hypothetical protein
MVVVIGSGFNERRRVVQYQSIETYFKARNNSMAAGVGLFIGYFAVFTGLALGLLYGLRFVKLI